MHITISRHLLHKEVMKWRCCVGNGVGHPGVKPLDSCQTTPHHTRPHQAKVGIWGHLSGITQASRSSASQAFPHQTSFRIWEELCSRREVKALRAECISNFLLGKLCQRAWHENHCPWVTLTKPGHSNALRPNEVNRRLQPQC